MSFSFDYPTPGTSTTTTTVTSPIGTPTNGSVNGSSQGRPRQQPGSACDECRRRKLRCDRKQPQCLACVNAGVTCVMRSTCPPRGPKKGHLKALRSQIAALETRLNEQEKGATMAINIIDKSQQSSDNEGSEGDNDLRHSAIHSAALTPDFCDMPFWSTPMSNAPPMSSHVPIDGMVDGVENLHPSLVFPPLDRVPVGVHLTPKACADLDQLYFDRVHAFAPILQKFRYLSWSKVIHKSRQRLCLQYAMWTLAASLSSQFQFIRGELYTEARQLLDALEMDTFGGGNNGVGGGSGSSTSSISSSPTNSIDIPGPKGGIEQVQAWILLSIYEFMSDDYQRGLVSAGRAFRLVQLMRLHEIDRRPATNLQGDWIDIESTRRTFWLAYTIDRFTSVNDELPLTFNEHEIRTRLPAPDAQFMSGRPTTMCFLSEVIAGTDGQQPNYALADLTMSPFTESIIIATICGRTLGHKQRSSVEQHAYRDVIQDFCHRHQSLHALLSSRIKSLAMQISSSSEHPDPMLIFVTLTAYMVVLMLCETVESIPLVTEEAHALLLEYKQRSLDAAHELGMLTTVLSQLNHFQTHPFTPIPLLLSARFCLSHMGLNDSYSTLLPGVATALQGLTSVNCLAQNCLRLLGLNVANEGSPIFQMQGFSI